MLDSANSLIPDVASTEIKNSNMFPERNSSNSITSETRQYHFNAPDKKRISENIRISWSSKRSGKGDGSIHSNDKAKSWNHLISPKPIDPSFFDLKNEAIVNEHNYRKDEFLRLLNSFLEEIEKF